MPNRPAKKNKKEIKSNVIYSFSVEKEEVKPVTTKRVNKETGEEEEVKTNKKVKSPIDFVIKKPSRRLVDESEVFYSVELSNCIKKGIVTKAMLQKKYADSGGALTDNQSKELLKAVKRSNEINNEYQLLISQKGKGEETEALEEELLELRRRMVELENSIQSEYQFTADSRAERNLILWFIIQLTRIKSEDGVEEEWFSGLDYEEQLEDLYKKDESEDSFNKQVLDTLYKAVSYWYYNNELSVEDIETLLNDEE